MAEIFLAREIDAPADALIVIKRLLGHISEHPGLVQMFLDEARIAATLDHPNIVKIYNVGTIGEHFFLSMEHLAGLDLSKVSREMRRQKRALPIQHVLYIAHRVCKALGYAHEHKGKRGEDLNIVHRDLSPHNVFLTLEGEIKLLDFGVAKAANALHKTKTGALVGKLAYMSPEHYRVAGTLDGRSDLFSLGIIIWELAVGRRLYNTKKLGEFEVLRRITEEPVPNPRHFRPDFPVEVTDVLDRALRKDRDERFPNADAFAVAIEAAASALDYELDSSIMREFVDKSMPEVVKRITSSIPRLDRTPQSSPSILSPSITTPPSSEPSFPVAPSEVVTINMVPDEERTEKRQRQPKVTWEMIETSAIQKIPPKEGVPTWVLVFALAVVGLVAVVVLVVAMS
jgi:serine/threonine protein kinase